MCNIRIIDLFPDSISARACDQCAPIAPLDPLSAIQHRPHFIGANGLTCAIPIGVAIIKPQGIVLDDLRFGKNLGLS